MREERARMKEQNESKNESMEESVEEKIRKKAREIDGKSLRRVSSARKDGSVPTLTLSAELKELGWRKGDWVVITKDTEKNRIIVEKL